MTRFTFTIFSLCAVLASCDGTPEVDAGPGDAGRRDAGPETDGGPDAGAPVGAPIVFYTLPEDGDEGVDPATRMLILFNESMSPAVGTVSVEPGGIVLSAADSTRATWVGDAELGIDSPSPRTNVGVVFSFAAPLQGGAEHIVTVNTDFVDALETPLAAPHTFRFTTLDEQPPRVINASPAEGATGLSAQNITAITVVFDEEMNTAVGSAQLLGGAGRLGDPSWNAAARAITWPVSGLAYDETYRVALADFVDRNGNDWDGAAYLGDSALDFSTGPDVDAPIVRFSVPTEGQRGVNPSLSTVELTFNEPMDTSIARGTLTPGTTLTGAWSSGGTVLTFAVAGMLGLRTDYRLDLTGHRDVVGNALDRVTYLGDGVLDFAVGEDTFGPRVVESSPVEGETDVDFAVGTIVVRFDEPMTTSIVRAPLTDGTTTVDVTGVWSSGGTMIAFDVGGRLAAGRSYTLDLRSFTDANGNALDVTHTYLVDGRLDFTTVPPRGDTCADALSVRQATTSSGVHEWTLGSGTYGDSGATDSCDDDGSAAADIVIAYEKTSGTLASGGALLHVEVDSADTTDINFEIRRSCEPSTGLSAQLACHDAMESGGATLDVGPGTYFIWIAKETAGSFPGARVRVSELNQYPEGESCNAPFTVSTDSPTYIAPTVPGGPHIWQIPPDAVRSFDRGTVTNGAADITCSIDHGADAVIRFDARPGSVVEVRAIPLDIRSSAADLNMELSSGCDPTATDFVSLGCAAGFDRARTITGSSPSGGPVYVWLSSDDTDMGFPGATVSITEILVSPGESCASAHPISGPSAPITLDSTRTLGAGTCLSASAPITWFAYTPTEDIVLASTDASGAMILVDRETSTQIACSLDASQPSAAFVRAGRTLCIGIPNTSFATTITTSERAYSGVRGIVTDLGIRRALNELGMEEAWTSESWMTTSSDTIFLGETDDVFFAPKAGMTRAVMAEGVSAAHLGDVGIAIGSALFGLDDVTTTTAPRVYRLWDGARFPWMPEPWDGAYTWPAQDLLAMTYDGTSFIVATDVDTSSGLTEFYSAPIASAGPITRLGANQNLQDVIGIAADATYFYVLGAANTAIGNVDGIHRVRRDQLDDPAAAVETLARFDVGAYQGTPIFVDDTTNATVLYARQVDSGDPNQIHAVIDPGSATPLYIGPILTLGTPNDVAMTYDVAERAIYLFETETDIAGRIVRVE